jgi:hypothetical protein
MKINNQHAGMVSWAARIICIAFAIFISIFSLDVFSEGYGFWKTIFALLLHLIPTFLIFLVLILSWRWEWIGGIIFSILGIVYIIAGRGKTDWSAIVFISGPLFILGILFFIGWYQKKHQPV